MSACQKEREEASEELRDGTLKKAASPCKTHGRITVASAATAAVRAKEDAMHPAVTGAVTAATAKAGDDATRRGSHAEPPPRPHPTVTYTEHSFSEQPAQP